MLGQCNMCCYVTNPSRGGGERFVNKVTDEQYKVVAYSIFPCLAFVVVAVITFMSRSSMPLLSNPPASRIQRDRSTAGDIQLWWLISACLWRSVVVVVLVVTHPLSRPIIVLCLLTLEFLWHHTVYWLADPGFYSLFGVLLYLIFYYYHCWWATTCCYQEPDPQTDRRTMQRRPSDRKWLNRRELNYFYLWWKI